MRYDLASLTRRTKATRRKVIPLRPIQIPATYASDLHGAAYAPVIALWTASLAPIMAEYERTLAQITTDAPADAASVISEVEASAAALSIAIRLRLETWVKRLEAWHRRKWGANVKAATGVDLGMMIGPGDARVTLETVVERNAALVRNVSDQTRQRIADAVFRGFQRKAPAREVAKELREAVGMARRRALLIASDQTTTLGAQLNQERMREAGIDSFIWWHSGKLHPREEHRVRNGLYYTENPTRVGTEYQGKTLRAAPSPDQRAGVPVHCGCVEQSLLILD